MVSHNGCGNSSFEKQCSKNNGFKGFGVKKVPKPGTSNGGGGGWVIRLPPPKIFIFLHLAAAPACQKS